MYKEWLKNNFYFLLRNSWALMYHNIDVHEIDPWDLAVPPDRFEEQLRWLKKHRRIVDIEDMISDWKGSGLRKHRVILTFDDGYLDNFIHAKPLLEKYELPAVFFITTNNLLTQTPFWWDELRYIVLQTPVLPSFLNIQIGTKAFAFSLDQEVELTPALLRKIKQWNYPLPADTKRAELYSKLSLQFQNLSFTQQQNVLQELKHWAGIDSVDCPGIMTREQLVELSRSNLFTIGAHTVTHAALGLSSEEEQRVEMMRSKETLENIIGKEVKFLAYPYGSYNATTLSMAGELGFEAAFTTQTIPLQKTTNQTFFGRLAVTKTMKYKKKIW